MLGVGAVGWGRRCGRRSCGEAWEQTQRQAWTRRVGRRCGREACERTWGGSDSGGACGQRAQEQGECEAVARMDGGCRPQTLLLSFGGRSRSGGGDSRRWENPNPKVAVPPSVRCTAQFGPVRARGRLTGVQRQQMGMGLYVRACGRAPSCRSNKQQGSRGGGAFTAWGRHGGGGQTSISLPARLPAGHDDRGLLEIVCVMVQLRFPKRRPTSEQDHTAVGSGQWTVGRSMDTLDAVRRGARQHSHTVGTRRRPRSRCWTRGLRPMETKRPKGVKLVFQRLVMSSVQCLRAAYRGGQYPGR